MKARKLKWILNNTGYSVSNRSNSIAVGSPMCPDLISVDKDTLHLTYALDTFNQGRKALASERQSELLFIWDKLKELIDSGEIKDIIEGKDIIENPLPVFTVSDGELIESVTDKYGWPNTDDNGVMIYENTHFNNREEAIEYGIKGYKYDVDDYEKMVKEAKQKVISLESDLQKYKDIITHLNNLKNIK